jgi:hypothetical protein
MTIVLNGTSGYSADFSNATVASRQTFQTSTTNGSTGIYALPNGTSTAASWQATNNSDPTNASKILIATNGSTDVQLVSGINGTGTYLPLTFYTNGAEKMRITTAGSVGINTSVPVSKLDVIGTSGITSFTGTTPMAITAQGATSTNDYSGVDFTENGNPPRARIASYFGGGGSYLQFGTSNNYGSGITNTAATIDPNGNLLVGTTTQATGALLTVNGSIKGTITSGTAVASTSGTAIDFTSIPSWVKRVTILLNVVSTNGTSYMRFQLGTGGSPTTTGYATSASVLGSVYGGSASSTSGFDSYADNNASWTRSGAIVFNNISGNTWVGTGTYQYTATAGMILYGTVTLAGVLNMVRITTVNGTDAFDAGTVNIFYEG